MIPSGPIFVVVGLELEFIDAALFSLGQTIIQRNIEEKLAKKHAPEVSQTNGQ